MAAEGFTTVAAMILIQVVFAGVNILYKLSLNDGMHVSILVAYRYIFAAIPFCPIAFFMERKTRPNLTWKILALSFASALFGGVLSQNLYINSMRLTSPTFASALCNLIPAVTFILAVLFSMEKLGIKTASGQAKVIGTVVGIAGAMIITFYKGPELNIFRTNINLLKDHGNAAQQVPPGNFLLGALFGVASNFSFALWMIAQAKLAKDYPCPYSSTALMCLMSAIQGTILAFCLERDKNQWKLGFDVRLLTVSFSGVVASALICSLLAWCIRKRGPLFASVFNPLMLVVVAVLSMFLLGERLHVGIVLGAAVIVIGLYIVLWGKTKETKKGTADLSARAMSMDSNFDAIL